MESHQKLFIPSTITSFADQKVDKCLLMIKYPQNGSHISNRIYLTTDDFQNSYAKKANVIC